MITVYKLRHVPTGLFYQPVKGRWSREKSNLSTRGKIYETHQYPKDLHTGGVTVSENIINKYSLNVKKTNYGNYLTTSENDWEIVEYNIVENKTYKIKEL